MKNILLTGASGFIGSHLKEYLGEYNFFSPRSKELNLLDKNATQKYIQNNNINIIIHSAACGVRILPEDTVEEVAKPNITMFNNLADSIDDKKYMIVIGSGAEYDKSKPIVSVKENLFGKSIPKDPYGYSKYMISKEIEKRNNILNLRLFGIYGYGEDYSRVTSYIIGNALQKKDIELNQNVKFSFIYIEDFCKIIKYFVDNPTKEKFINIASDKDIEIIELTKIVNSFLEHKVKIFFKKEGLNKEYTANISKLKSIISNFKFTSYEDGMKNMYKQMFNSKR